MIVKSGLEFLFWNSARPFRVAAAQYKNVNFKTRDFSQIIEWVLAGVM